MTTDELNASTSELPMDGQGLTVVLQEWNTLKDLNFELERSTHSLFNYYLTLVATIASGSILVLQLIPSLGETNSIYVIGIILALLSFIGVLYSAAMAHRYAHIFRYAQALDEIRRNLFNSLPVSLPPLYDRFRADRPVYPTKIGRFAPLGTFHLFETFLSSLLLAVGFFIILLNTNPTQAWSVNLWIAIATMLVMFCSQLYYGQVIRGRFNRTLNLRINTRG
jgi:hypothetical protein